MAGIRNLPARRVFPLKLLAKCMGTQNAMAAEVQVLMGDMQPVHMTKEETR